MVALEAGIKRRPDIHIGRSERPIEYLSEDTLGRDGLVRRLVSAVISAQTGKATGVAVGITGPWDSGKSSILNLIQERIRRDHQDTVVVRFDPWLASGRNDLISAFINGLLGAIKAERRATKLLRSATDTLARYGHYLSPAFNLAAPGWGSAIAGVFGGLKARLSRC